MIQETKVQSYRGVLCRHCRQPIPLPAIVISLENAGEEEKSTRVFTLRCRACENEHMYKSTDIADFEGTPRPRPSRGRFARTPSRHPGGLAKAANA